MKVQSCLLLLFVCMGVQTSYSQTIEVIVEEQVQLKPTDYLYIVTYSNPYDGLDFDLDIDEYDEEEEDGKDLKLDEPNLEELELTLEQQKFKFTRVEREVNMFSGSSDALQVELPNEAELKRLEKLLETFEKVNGYVESANFEDKSVHLEKVYPNLVASARKEAEIMAKAAGKTVGMVLSIQEIGNENDIWSSLIEGYGKMFKKIGMSKELGIDPTVLEVEFKFMFRFELK